MPPHVFLVGGYPNLEVPSGMISYVTNLIPNLLRSGAEVTLIGVSGESSELPYKINLISMGRFSNADSCTLWVKLWRFAATARLPPDAILHAQKTLDILPFCVLRPRVPKVLTIHGDHRKHIKAKYGGVAVSLYALLERIAFRLTNKVIFVSGELYEDYSKRLRPRGDGHYTVLPPGVDGQVFHPASRSEARAKFGLGGGVVIGFSGRFAPEKRIDLLLEVFKKFRQQHGPAELLLLGPSEADLRSLGVEDPKSNGVRAMGILPRDQVAQALAAMDVFVLTSDREGLPTALLEAVAVGVPVVAREVGDVREVVVDGGVGYTVKSGDPDLLSAAIAKAVKMHVPDQLRMAVLTKYSWSGVVRSLMGIYEEVLQKSASKSRPSKDRTASSRFTR